MHKESEFEFVVFVVKPELAQKHQTAGQYDMEADSSSEIGLNAHEAKT